MASPVPVPCAARCPAPGAGCARRAGAGGRRLRCGPSRHHVPAPGRVPAPIPLCPRPFRVAAAASAPADLLPFASALGPLRRRRLLSEEEEEEEKQDGREGRARDLTGVRCGSRGRPSQRAAAGRAGELGRRGGPAGRREETATEARKLSPAPALSRPGSQLQLTRENRPPPRTRLGNTLCVKRRQQEGLEEPQGSRQPFAASFYELSMETVTGMVKSPGGAQQGRASS